MRARLHDDAGGVLVFVAGSLSVLLLLVMFVVDLGNAWEHRRHLQTQVDAAALAGGQAMQDCFSGGGAPGVFSAATEYAGATGTYDGTAYGTPRWNVQVGGADRGALHVLYQSPTWFNGTTDPGAPTGSPCDAPYTLDVKGTESGLPLFFAHLIPGLSSVSAINARARVQLFPLASAGPGLPLAVPNVDPQQVSITFVDANGAELTSCSGTKVAGTTCTYPLAPGGTANGLAVWTAATPLTITVPKGRSGSYEIGLGSVVGPCDGAHTGGATYTCFAPPTDPASTDPLQQVLLSPADLSAGSHTLASVSVGLLAPYTVATPCGTGSGADYSCPSDPSRLFRIADQPGSTNYVFDCGGNGLRDEIENGCTTTYAVNRTGTCPDTADPVDCATAGSTGSGDKLGQIRSALDARFAPNGVCSIDRYPSVAADDPRLAVLVVTSAEAWDGQSGSGATVPVIGFAAFYVTGWDGTPCATNEPYPGTGSPHGDLWGHFVKYVDTFGDPDTTEACDAASTTPCVPVLTR